MIQGPRSGTPAQRENAGAQKAGGAAHRPRSLFFLKPPDDSPPDDSPPGAPVLCRAERLRLTAECAAAHAAGVPVRRECEGWGGGHRAATRAAA